MSSKGNILINSAEVAADMANCLRIYEGAILFSSVEMQGAYVVLCGSLRRAVILPGELPRRKAGFYCRLFLMHVKEYCVGMVEVQPYLASNKPVPIFLSTAQVEKSYPELYRRWETASKLLTRPVPLVIPTSSSGPTIIAVDLV